MVGKNRGLSLVLVVVGLLAATPLFGQTVTIAEPAGQTAVVEGNAITVTGSGWPASATVDSGFSSTFEYQDNGTSQTAQVGVTTTGLSVDGSGNLTGTFTLGTKNASSTRVRLRISVNSGAATANSNFVTYGSKAQLTAAEVEGTLLRLTFNQAMQSPGGNVAASEFTVTKSTGATTPNLTGVANGSITLGSPSTKIEMQMSAAAQPLVLNNQIRFTGSNLKNSEGIVADTTLAAVAITEVPTVTSASYNVNTKTLTVNFSLAVTVASVSSNKSALAVAMNDGSSPIALTNATLTTASNGTSMAFTATHAIDVAIIALTQRNLVYTPGSIVDTLGNSVAAADGTEVVLSYTADTGTAPTISDIRQLAADVSTVKVTFSEYVDETSAENTANYTSSGGQTLSTATLQSDGVAVILDFTSNIDDTVNTLSVSGVKDTSQNTMTTANAQDIGTEFDSDTTVGAGVLSVPATIDSITAASAAVDVFDFRIIDGGTTDGQPTNVTQIIVDVTGTGTPSDVTWRLRTSSMSNVTGTVSGTEVTFSGLSVAITNSSQVTFTLSAQCATTMTSTVGGQTFIMSIDRGNVTVSATSTRMVSGNGTAVSGTTTYDVTPTALSISTQPSGATSGANFSTQPVVRLVDANGNRDASDSASTVTASLQSGTGSIHGGSTTVKTVASGIATFTDLRIDTTGAKTLRFSTNAGAFTVDSSSFTVAPGAVASITIATHPAGALGGTAFSTQPVIHLLDAASNIVTTNSTTTVRVAIQAVGGGGSLSGTSPVTASSGVVTFSGLSINTIGSGYTLRFTCAATATTADSNSFDVSLGSIDSISVATQPASATGGTAFGTQPVVRLLDAGANIITTNSSTTVRVAIQTNPGSGALGGTKTITASSGVVTFTNLAIDKIGTGYTLRFTCDSTSDTVDSSSFNVSLGSINTIAVQTEPAGATGGTAFTTQPVIRLLDAGSNIITTDSTTTVRVAIQAVGGGGALSGTTVVAASSGVVTYAGLSINTVGTGYTLRFTCDSTSDTVDSSAFNVTPGAIDSITVQTHPAGATGGTAFSTQPVIRLLDAGSNIITTNSTTTVRVAIQAVGGGGSLSGTSPVTASSGVVTFSGLSINTVGTGYTLRFTCASSGDTVDSNAFNVTLGPIDSISVATQPAGATGGTAFSTQPVINLLDAGANIITSNSTTTVRVAIQAVGGGGALSGTSVVTASSGVVTYAGLSINTVGTGYTLRFTCDSTSDTVDSSAFNVTPGAIDSISVATQPAGALGGTAFSTQPVVRLLDAGANIITTNSTTTVRVAIQAVGGGGSLSGAVATAASSGVVTFSGLSINTVGTGYTLRFTCDSTSDTVDSSAFAVTPGAIDSITVQTHPAGATGGTAFSTQPVIRLLDPGSNVITTDSTTTVRVAIQAVGGGGSLSGTSPVTVSSGVATFAGLSINTVGTGYTLRFTCASSGDTVDSNAFNVTLGPIDSISVATQPAGATGGTAFSTQPVINLLDAGANIITSNSTTTVRVAIQAVGGGGALSGTTVVAASSGVVTYAGLSINTVGTGYTLRFTCDSTSDTVDSSAFNVTPGAIDSIAVATQPAGALGGTAFSTQPVINLLDAGSNIITTNSTTTVRVAIQAVGGGGSLSGAVATAASSGVITFSGLSINTVGAGYTLRFTCDSTADTVDSGAFTVSLGPIDSIAVQTHPAGATGGTAFSTQPVVRLFDAGANVITSNSSTTVRVAIQAVGGGGSLSGTSVVTASSGVVTYAGLSINTVGTGYTLRFTCDSSGDTVDSNSFNVTLGSIDSISVATQPAGALGGTAFSTQPVINLLDAGANIITSNSSTTVRVAIQAVGGGGSLSGTSVVTASSGVVTYAGLSINTVGTGYTLRFTCDSTADTVDSSAFNVTPGAIDSITVQTHPAGATGGTAFSTQPVIRLLDPGSNIITTDSTTTVRVAIQAVGGGGSLSGTSPVTASSGVVTFSGLSINTVGTGYTLRFTCASSGDTVDSNAFNVTLGPIDSISVATQPAGATGGTAFSTQPVINLLDAGANIITSNSSTTVRVAIQAVGGGGALSGTSVVTASSGVVTYAGLSINTVGTGYTLRFTCDSTSDTVDSSAFNVTPGAIDSISVATQPAGALGGTAFSTQPVINLLDAGSNIITTNSTTTVRVAIQAAGGGGSLSGTLVRTASSGVITFNGLSINTVGTGYTLRFTCDSSSDTVDSGAFAVTPGAIDAISVQTQPSGATGGTAFTTQPVIRLLDPGLNVITTDSATTVRVAIQAVGGGGSLSGTSPVTVSSGVATFAGLSINTVGTGYTLRFTCASSGDTVDSNAFNVTLGPIDSISVATQPAGATGGTAFTTQPVVRLLDAGSNIITSNSSTTVRVAIQAVGGGGSLSGTSVVTASSGVVTYAGLSINTVGTGYTLRFTCDSTSDTVDSSAFAVTPGAIDSITVQTHPAGALGGTAFSTQPVIRLLDAGSNIITTDSTTTVRVAIQAVGGGGSLSGTSPVTVSSGIATFAGLSINTIGAGYTLRFTCASSGDTVDSNAFAVSLGPIDSISVATQPAGALGGTAFSTQPVVRLLDAGANIITTNSATTVRVAIQAVGGGGALSGTSVVTASSGVVTYAGLSINTVGTGYTLRFTCDSTADTVDSSSFNVTFGPIDSIAVATQPAGALGGTAFSTQPVINLLDAGSNIITSNSSTTVRVAIQAVGGGGSLSGTTPVTASSGVVTFTNLSINTVGAGYTLRFTCDSSSDTVDSSAFAVSLGPIDSISVATQPAGALGGTAFSTQPVINLLDAGLNIITTNSTTTVRVAIQAVGGGGSLSGTSPVTASSGVVTFSGLSINTVGTGYTLRFTCASSGDTVDSNAFNVTFGPIDSIAVATQPAGALGGTAFSTQPVINLLDAGSNIITSNSTTTVRVAIQAVGGGGSLSGTSPVTASSGVVTFSGLSINTVGAGYTLRFTCASSGDTVDSSAFAVSFGPLNSLQVSVQPSGAAGGTVFTTQPAVRLYDAGLNLLTNNSSTTIRATIQTNPGSGTLSGTKVATASAGVVTFTNLEIDKIGTGYVLRFTDNETAGGFIDSSAFNVSLGILNSITVATQPAGALGGSAFSTQPVIQMLDPGANIITTNSTTTIRVAIQAVGGGGTLSGTTVVAASSGVVTYAGLSINTVGTGYTLRFTVDSTGDTVDSSSFNVTPGPIDSITVATQPAGALGGTAFSTQPVVRLLDAGSNIITTNSTATVRVAIQAVGGGGTLSGATAATTASSGVVTFSGLSINTIGTGYTLRFTCDSSGDTVDSNAFDVTLGPIDSISVATQPAGALGGSAFSTQPVIRLLDAGSNIITTNSTTTVSVAIQAVGGGGALSGAVATAASSGVVTFSGLSINTVGTGYTLRFTCNSTADTVDSAAFNVTPGPIANISMATQPAGARGGTVFTTQPVINLLDAGNNVITTNSTTTVRVAIQAVGGGGTLSGATVAPTASSGVVTFSGLSINTVGTGYTLRFTCDSSGDTVDSAAFDVTPGAIDSLIVATEPAGALGGTAFTTQPVIRLLDPGLNIITTDSTTTVSVAIQAVGGGGTLSGTSSVMVSSGVATFAGLSINTVGTGYTLRFTCASSGDTVDSASFDVTLGPIDSISVATQPAGARGGTAFTTQPVIRLLDAGLNIITTNSTTTVRVAIQAVGGGGSLSGTTPVTASSGTVTFTNLSINTVGTGYTLRFTCDSSSDTVDSGAFDVTPGAIDSLIVATQPAGALGGTAFATQPVIRLLDPGLNIITTDSTTTVRVAIQAVGGGGTLSGAVATAASSGTVTFSGLSINTVGTGYTLRFTCASSGDTVDSSAFDVTLGPIDSITVATQPAGATGGTAFSTQPVIRLLDAGLNIITTNSTTTVRVAIQAVGGGGTLSGTSPVTASSGTVTFSGLSINTVGTGYTLRFTCASSGDTIDSNAFDVTFSAPASLAIATQPAGARGGLAFTTQPAIRILDAGSNIITSNSTTTVRVAIQTNPASGTISSTLTATASGGTATFAGLEIDKVGTGYTLRFTSGSLTSVDSAAFDVTPGTAASLSVATQPAGAAGGTAFTTQPVVHLLDDGGNVITTDDTTVVSVTLTTSPGTGVLSGTMTMSVTDGVATFAGLSIDKVGTGYVLGFSANAGAQTVSSSAFDVAIGVPASLVVTTQPVGDRIRQAFPTQPQVTMYDAGGNLVSNNSTATVTAAIGNDASTGQNAVLSGQATVVVESGVATFVDLEISQPGLDFTLVFSTNAGVFTVESSSFELIGGPVLSSIALDDRDNDQAITDGDILYFMFEADEVLVNGDSVPPSNATGLLINTVLGLSAGSFGSDAVATLDETGFIITVMVAGSDVAVASDATCNPSDALTNTEGDPDATSGAIAMAVAASDIFQPTIAISLSTMDTENVPPGELVITAIFSDTQATAPTISVTQAGTNDVTNVAMTVTPDSLGRAWTYALEVGLHDGVVNVDGVRTITVSGQTEDDQGNDLVGATTLQFSTDTRAPAFSSLVSTNTDSYYKAGDTISLRASLTETTLMVTANLSVVDSAMGTEVEFVHTSGGVYTLTSPALSEATMIEGVNTYITVTAMDGSGNESTMPVLVTIDKSAPTANLLYSQPSTAVGQGGLVITLALSEVSATIPTIAIDGLGASSVDTTAMTGSAGSTSFTYTMAIPNGLTGNATVTIGNVIDLAGNEQDEVSNDEFTVDATVPAALIVSITTPTAALTGPQRFVMQAVATSTAPASSLSYAWEQIAGPVEVELTLAGSSATTYISTPGTYQFEVTVTSGVLFARASTQVVMANAVPVISAGNQIVLGASSVVNGETTLSLQGRAIDANNETLTVLWSLESGPIGGNLSVTNPTQLSSTLQVGGDGTEIVGGVYKFKLSVWDAKALQESSPVTATVQVAVISDEARPPAAHAGLSKVTRVGQTLQLTGNESSDGDGIIEAWAWTVVSSPTNLTAGVLTGETTMTPTFTPEVEGTYIFGLVVTDDDDYVSSMATVNVLVLAAVTNPNNPPRSLIDVTFDDDDNNGAINVGEEITLDASGSLDAEGDELTYTWTLVSGLGSLEIDDPTAETLVISPSEAGNYEIKLVANDGRVDGIEATVSFAVAANSQMPPHGGSIEISDEDDPDGDRYILFIPGVGVDGENTNPTIDLNASGWVGEGSLVYSWYLVDGPLVVLEQASADSNTNFTPVISRTYSIKLVVTDENGLFAEATIDLAVDTYDPDLNPDGNAVPRITLPEENDIPDVVRSGSTVTFTATGSDANNGGANLIYTYVQAAGYPIPFIDDHLGTLTFDTPVRPDGYTIVFKVYVDDGADIGLPLLLEFNVDDIPSTDNPKTDDNFFEDIFGCALSSDRDTVFFPVMLALVAGLTILVRRRRRQAQR